MADDSSEDQIRVKVLSQFRTLYDDYALSLSAQNETGPFDILKGHANFLTLLSPGTIVIRRADDSRREVDTEKGIIRVANDVAEVFLDV